jgi:hypothetical protein
LSPTARTTWRANTSSTAGSESSIASFVIEVSAASLRGVAVSVAAVGSLSPMRPP